MIYLHIPITFVYCSMININTKRKDVEMKHTLSMRKPKDRAVVWSVILSNSKNTFTMDDTTTIGCHCTCHRNASVQRSSDDWSNIR